jgi:hypothetical protein
VRWLIATAQFGHAYKMETKKRSFKLKDESEIPKEDRLDVFAEKLSLKSFAPDTCFLCDSSLNEVEASSEHIFPRWLQKRFDLWDQTLVLLNRTTIPYRQLTVPCRANCNNNRLQPIETSVSLAVEKGPKALRALGDKTLFLWLGKIFYGLLYKELFLLLDRSVNQANTIATQEMLKAYESHLFFLQQARGKIELVDFCPGSIFVFWTQELKNERFEWDFCDNIDTMFVGIRMGGVGVIGVLGDGGAQLHYSDAYKDIMDLPLHPLQFRELCAHFAYRATRGTRTPKYFTIQDKPHKVFQLPLGGFSAKPLFEGWDFPVYSKFLAFYTGCPEEDCFHPPDAILTFLHDESGKPKYMDFKKYPYLPDGQYVPDGED